jgi:hypothetical protein
MLCRKTTKIASLTDESPADGREKHGVSKGCVQNCTLKTTEFDRLINEICTALRSGNNEFGQRREERFSRRIDRASGRGAAAEIAFPSKRPSV